MNAARILMVALAWALTGGDVSAQAQLERAPGKALPGLSGVTINRQLAAPQMGQVRKKADKEDTPKRIEPPDRSPRDSTVEVAAPIKHDPHEMDVALKKAALECATRIAVARASGQPKPDCADKP